MEFVKKDFVNVSKASMEMAVNLKDAQRIVISMEYVHRTENVFAMRISVVRIVEKNVARMIAMEMEYVIPIKNVCAKLDLLEKIVQPRLAKIIVEEFFKEFVSRANASAEMDTQVLPVDLRLVPIAVRITESALRGNVNVSPDTKEQIVQLKFARIIVLDMEYVQVLLFLNVLVTMDLQELIVQ
jgi:hypothetical protein